MSTSDTSGRRWQRYLPVILVIQAFVFIGLYVASARGGQPWLGWPLLLTAFLILIGSRKALIRPPSATLKPSEARLHRLEESLLLPHPSERVWALLYPAENAPLLSPDVVRGYRLQGSPEGVGERQAFVSSEGSITIAETLEMSPGRRAVTRVVSPQPRLTTHFTFDLQPQDTGCLLTVGEEYKASKLDGWSKQEGQDWRRLHRSWLERVGRVLDEQALLREAH